uniref:Putative ovule protein n=1 Tax=Solanum chacoense TaxID=4108 RepID=A0A0V0H102_SOLCH
MENCRQKLVSIMNLTMTRVVVGAHCTTINPGGLIRTRILYLDGIENPYIIDYQGHILLIIEELFANGTFC